MRVNTELFIVNCMCCMSSDSLIFLSVFITWLQLLPLKNPTWNEKLFCSVLTRLLNFHWFIQTLGQEGGADGIECDKSKSAIPESEFKESKTVFSLSLTPCPVVLDDISMGQLVSWRNSCDFCKYNEALVASKNSVSPPNRERAFIPWRGVSALPSCLIRFSL